MIANFALNYQDDRLIEKNEVKLNESKIFNVWTIMFATHNQLYCFLAVSSNLRKRGDKRTEAEVPDDRKTVL